MSTSESFEALRRANPRAKGGFDEQVGAAAEAIRAQLVTGDGVVEAEPRSARRLIGFSAAGMSLAAAALVVFLLAGSPGGGPGVEDAAAAFEKATTLTASSAERSGSAAVRMTHNGEPWAGIDVRWHDGDLVLSSVAPRRPGKVGSELRVVDGMMYGVEAGGWVELGSPKSIDPDSGTTPDEYLAAVREDVGGVTVRRITRGMTGLTTRELADGSTVYSGTVSAGLIARETGFKEGQSIRVLPFGYVAHDEASDPAAALDTAVTVGRDDIVRKIAVRWGTESSAWTYTVTYERLGATPAPVAPRNARPFRRMRG